MKISHSCAQSQLLLYQHLLGLEQTGKTADVIFLPALLPVCADQSVAWFVLHRIWASPTHEIMDAVGDKSSIADVKTVMTMMMMI
jgi:hypothetical protein